MDFRRLDKYAICMDEYFDVQEKTLDVPDYVPAKYLEKIDKLLFKEFKRTRKQARKEHIRECKDERKIAKKNLRQERRKERIARLKGFFKRLLQRLKKDKNKTK